MAGSPLFFGRYYRLTIECNNFSMTAETSQGKPAMDIKFDVTYARGQTAREGTVSILGLGYKKIHEILKLAALARGEAMSKQVHLRLDAGYFTKAGHVNIFDGFVWYATVTSPPEMWLNMKVSEVNIQGDQGMEFNNGQTAILPLKEFMSSVLKQIQSVHGYVFKIIDKTQDKIYENSETKISPIELGRMTVAQAIQKINLGIANHKLEFIFRNSLRSGKVRTIEAIDTSPEKAAPERPTQVNQDTGLLSVTGIDVVQGCVSTFLSNMFPDYLSKLELKSKLNPQANGTYYIIKKQYVGHYMGQEWYARYFCSGKKKDK